jgi:Mrp family chromosome partitioning ATPase
MSINSYNIFNGILGAFSDKSTIGIIPVDSRKSRKSAGPCIGLSKMLADNLPGKVVAVDASIPDGSFDNTFPEINHAGLSDLCNDNPPEINHCLIDSGMGFSVMPFGNNRSKGNVNGYLSSIYMDNTIKQLRDRYKYVLVQLPSPDNYPAIYQAASKFDTVVITLTYAFSRWEPALCAVSQFKEYGINPCGVIMDERRFVIPRWLYGKL